MCNFAKKYRNTVINIKHIAAMALLALIVAGCAGTSDDSMRNQTARVYTFKPESNPDLSSTFHTSSVEEGRSVSAGFKTGGQIKRLTADEGSYVKKGQVIGYLDDTDYKLSVTQLETQYSQVASELKRIEEMHRHNNVSDNDYEKATAGFRQLGIQLDMAKNQLAYTRLEAPVSGYIVERSMEEGEMAGAGTPVFRIVDNSNVETTVAMSPSAYSRRNEIVKCTGRSAVTGESEIPLEMIGFIPDGDNNALFRMRLKIPDEYRDRLLPGMNMSVEIRYRSAENAGMQRIPSRALFERDGKSYVWCVNRADSTLSAREVTISGAPEGKNSLVTGLADDDEIVAAGVHHLTDRQKVRVIGSADQIKSNSGL